MNVDLTVLWKSVFDGLMALAVAVIVAFLPVLLKEGVAWLKQNVDAKTQANFEFAVNGFVWAAEQLKRSGAFDSKQAYNYVLDLAQAWLTKRGIKLDLREVAAVIEASVAKELNREYIGPGLMPKEMLKELNKAYIDPGSPAVTTTLDVTEELPE